MREGQHPYGVIRDAVRLGVKRAIVGVSGGIDSVATLDLCVRHGIEVRAYFMFIVPGLSFQESYLQYLERRFKIAIKRTPHWMLARLLSHGVLRHRTNQTAALRQCRPAHFLAWIRQQFETQWVATGEKAADSLERNTQLVRDGAIQSTRNRFYPLAWWSTADVQSHLARNQIALPPDYRLNASLPESLRTSRGSSFGGILNMREILPIAENYPEDYARIRKMFPLVDVQLHRWRQLNARNLVSEGKAKSEVCRRVNAKRRTTTTEPTATATPPTTTDASDGQEAAQE